MARLVAILKITDMYVKFRMDPIQISFS